MGRLKINIYSLMSYALFFVVFRPYFLPEILRLVLKIGVLIGLFLFIVCHLQAKKLLNCSLIFCCSIFLSAIVATLNGNFTFKAFLDSLLYALTFYDLYTFAQLCDTKGYADKLITSFFRIDLIYCILTIISILIVGIDNNSNRPSYLFGNKFLSIYYFIFLLALYGASHNMKMKKNKTIFIGIFILSILLSLYIDCATATVALALLFLIYLSPQKIKQWFTNEKIIVIALIMSAVIIIWIELILRTNFVVWLVTDFFGKSYTVSGRLEIYHLYLADIIKNSFWFGYGYSNSIIESVTGVFANAQNGLLQILVTFGFFGVLAILFTTYYCYKKSNKGNKTFYLSLVVCGMIIAAVFEVTINWFFLSGLCLIRWNCNSDSSNKKSIAPN